MNFQPFFIYEIACERATIEAIQNKSEFTVLGFINGAIVTRINGEWITL